MTNATIPYIGTDLMSNPHSSILLQYYYIKYANSLVPFNYILSQ